jgi:hypothetical protein
MGIALGKGAEIAETDGLEMNAPLPLMPELLQRRVPGLSHRAGTGVDVAAQCVGAMRIGAAQREVGPPVDVGFGPATRVLSERLDRVPEFARGVGRPVPGVSFVEVGVHIEQAGQDDHAVQIRYSDRRGRRCSLVGRGHHGNDARTVDSDIAFRPGLQTHILPGGKRLQRGRQAGERYAGASKQMHERRRQSRSRAAHRKKRADFLTRSGTPGAFAMLRKVPQDQNGKGLGCG